MSFRKMKRLPLRGGVNIVVPCAFLSSNESLKHAARFKPSSQAWLRRQLSDPYVKQAATDNYRCRSAYKLVEIDDKHKFLQPGNVVIDLGASPGSWSQVAAKRVNADKSDTRKPVGLVLGVDLSHFLPLPGVLSFCGCDFTKPETIDKLTTTLRGRQVSAVISDMAPNASGVRELDKTVILDLCLKALAFAQTVLKPGGAFLCKFWDDPPTIQRLKSSTMAAGFEFTKLVKPAASRADSSEMFLFANNYQPSKAKK